MKNMHELHKAYVLETNSSAIELHHSSDAVSRDIY